MNDILTVIVYMTGLLVLLCIGDFVIYLAARDGEKTRPIEDDVRRVIVKPKSEHWTDKYFRGEFDPEPEKPLRKIVIRERIVK